MTIVLVLVAAALAIAVIGIALPIPLGLVNVIPEQIQDKPEDDTGTDNDVVIDRPNGIIYVKISGTWTQVYPAVIL